jgi:4,5-dihydroxyphthalate decarboxylase
MLAEGKLDAALHPDLIKPLMRRDSRVARLFPNFKDEEIAYYKRSGIFPIMHLMGIKQEIVDRHPWIPINMFHAFNEAKAIAMKRMENPRIVPLIWYREAREEQEESGHDPCGIRADRAQSQQHEHARQLLPRAGPEPPAIHLR